MRTNDAPAGPVFPQGIRACCEQMGSHCDRGGDQAIKTRRILGKIKQTRLNPEAGLHRDL